MERYHPRKPAPVAAYGSEGVVVDPVCLARGWAAASLLRVAPGGVVGGHEAGSAQAIRVLLGAGMARTREGAVPLEVGATVRFAKGEWHETRATAEGLVLLVLEGDELDVPDAAAE